MSDFLPFGDQVSLVEKPGVRTMDSREIAELTGKRHDHVMRDIEEQIGRLGGLPRFGDTYRNEQNGQSYHCYKLPYRETMILVSGYSVELRARVIDRWMELERSVSALPDFTNPVAAARAWADQTEAKIKAEEALALAGPKIALAEAVGRSEKNMSITDVAKIFSLHPRTEVFPYLRAHEYLTHDDLPTSKAIEAGYLALRVTTDHLGATHSQAVVETWMLENWRAHVVHQINRWCGKIE